MKIAVCLPTLNESANIAHITRTVDRGLDYLVSLWPETQAQIINIDSDSADDTVKIFLNTPTTHSKSSRIISNTKGKGNNILDFCFYAVENQIDYCLTIDSDITSASPDWIIKLVLPLINDGAQFVTPTYKRSRYEGSSTNHFAFPMIYSFTGYPIRQPIAGDFAFTNKIALLVTENKLRSNPNIQKYGIDIFMTLIAISSRSKVAQVGLEQKIHSPSFNKLESMFPQIAASALLGLRGMSRVEESDLSIKQIDNILPNAVFIHRKSAKKMMAKSISNLSKPPSWIKTEFVDEFVEKMSDTKIDQGIKSKVWATILRYWCSNFLKPTLTANLANQAGQSLLPFFELRATSFWFWAETVNATEVENIIWNQANIIKDNLKPL